MSNLCFHFYFKMRIKLTWYGEVCSFYLPFLCYRLRDKVQCSGQNSMPTLSKISDKVTTASYRRSKNGESKLIQEKCTLHWLIPLNKDILPEKKLHRQPGIIRLYSNQLQLFIDFLISCKILKNNPIDDLRAMRILSKIWVKILNKQIRTSQYEKI